MTPNLRYQYTLYSSMSQTWACNWLQKMANKCPYWDEGKLNKLDIKNQVEHKFEHSEGE